MTMPCKKNIKETHVSVSIAAVDVFTGDSLSSLIFKRMFAPSSPPGEVKYLLVAPSLKEKVKR